MKVVATAGHVDHGKSTLVRALTGMEPDRWAEERRRGDDHRPRVRLDDPAVRRDRRVRRRARPRAVRAEHARRGRPGPRRAVRGRRRRGLDAAVRGAPGRAATRSACVRGAGGDPRGPGRPGAGARPRPAGDWRERASVAVEAVAVSGATGAGLPELRAALERLARPAAPRPTSTAAGPALGGPRLHRRGAAAPWSPARSAAGRLSVGDELVLAGTGEPVRCAGCSRWASPGESRGRVPGGGEPARGAPRPARTAATRCSPRGGSAAPTSSTSGSTGRAARGGPT